MGNGVWRESVSEWRTHSIHLGRSFFGGAVAGAVVCLLLGFVASQIGLIDWSGIASIAPDPWNQVLNPLIGPKMLRMLAAEALAFAVVVGGATLLFAAPQVRAIFGRGSLVVFRRAIGLAWIPVLSSAYLLTQVGPDQLILEITVHGDTVDLTVPTLLGVVFFGVAALALAPGASGRYLPLPLEILADVAPLIVALGILLSLDQDVSGQARPWTTYVGNVVIVQLTLATAELIYVLTAAEAAIADWRDLQRIWLTYQPRLVPPWSIVQPGQSRLRAWLAQARLELKNAGRYLYSEVHVLPAFARFAARLTIFSVPVLIGMWMAFGYQLSYASPILDRNGKLIEYYHGGAPLRLYIPADQISPLVLQAIDATEDPGIYSSPATHSPINPVRVAGIFTAAASSGALSGGSGLATQSCKNLVGRSLADDVWDLPNWLPGKRQVAMGVTLGQKLLVEFPCGWAFERTALFTRPRGWIVAFYLDQIYLGQGVYGVQAASQTYFGQDASNLILSQAALLAGLPQAPSYYDPWANPEAVANRREVVVKSMEREGYITPAQGQRVDSASLGVLDTPKEFPNRAADFIANDVVDWLDQNNFTGMSTGGYTVTTTLDLAAQQELQSDLAREIRNLKSRGIDSGAVILVDPRTGEVRAWLGEAPPGASANVNDLVGAIPHQPGSAIKPLLYSCALEEGKLKPDEKLSDQQRVIGGKYVANWDLKSHGTYTAREALAESSNVAAAELTERLTSQGFADCLHSVFQVQADLHPDDYGVFLGIGLSPIPMPQIAAAYTVLATGGVYHPLDPIAKVQDRDGSDLYVNNSGDGEVILDCATTAWVTRAMGDVSQVLGIPSDLATKTGTTPASAYGVGYASNALLVAWMGNLSNNGVQLATDDVFGREGGGQVWKDWALKHETAPSAAPPSSCKPG